MRFLPVLAVIVTASSAVAQAPGPPDTSYVEFLFVDDSVAYVRCALRAEPSDSFACEGLGPPVESTPPIWKFRLGPGELPFSTGDSLLLLRFTLPQRGARVMLHAETDSWDPLALNSAHAWAHAALFHRSLFKRYGATQPLPDLALNSHWQGHDLYVVIDTSQRFGDGTQINAYSVKSSLERYFWYRRDVPGYSWQYSIAGVENYRRGHVGHIVGLIPRSRDTLQFNLSRPNYSLPSRLAATETAIVRWQVQDQGAPVTATAGYYGQRTNDVVFGRPPQGGMISLTDEPDAFVPSGPEYPPRTGKLTVSDVDVPVPRLLVLRGHSGLDRSLFTFLDHAVDRRAMAQACYGSAARLPVLAFPTAAESARDVNLSGLNLPTNQSTDTWKIDLDAAQEARRQIRGRPRLRIAFEYRWESAAIYLVDALKAWNFTVDMVGPAEPFDLRIEEWNFGTFEIDALVETVLHQSGAGDSDTLVAKLQAARGNPTLRRTADYVSLSVRLIESPTFVPLCQPVVTVRMRSGDPVEFELDAVGRPAGAILRAAGR